MREVAMSLDHEHTVKTVSGEKCSKASANAANQNRCLSVFGRQSSGRKMDYIFMEPETSIEVGCAECGLVSGVKTTKELLDAGFKMPKVLKDMANSIMFNRSGLRHELCMVEFYMGARLDGYGPAEYPNLEKQICSELPRVLRLICQGRMLMKANKTKIDDFMTIDPVRRLGEIPSHIVKTFVPVVKTQKKRKAGNQLD
ncbi:hypothetical protein MUCCIDRAFT_79378 [Mucor lusitanicus CBS 277.49]|uniref:Uncharacterized protein n=1 Tax=Mucor lusitanicus CBS 277.49 TaxID=747725 RepID=A0A162TFT2_MUCCL|nr:hypothetical protein MUCCIDRAFT_79378 [Mucor lusitanicus CBS 277.49]